ncbi:Nucleoside transporter/FeoB GTPase Gate domain-containing protein [Vibrio crassostreae]|nr:Nucleoside transporter/FeoB GTPase Gate domain-containing protein [Vibrio crassostreae]
MAVTMKFTYQFFKELLKEIFDVTSTLFRIMIPIIIVIKVIEELGGIVILSEWLSPIMESVGLPKEMGLVWATTILTNIYAGLIILISSDVPLTVAQASVLGSMMLLAHSLPIEGAIARKAGVSWLATLSVRVGGSLVLAWLLNLSYQYGDLLNYPATVLWQPEVSTDTSYLAWALDQIKSFAVIFMVISALLLLLKILKLVGIEKLMAVMLRPFLRLLGISKDATNLTIIGITLGLSFGGGLLINEAKNGHISARDVFTAIMLLNLLHSLIEDTLLILLIGADFYTIFWGRLVFSVLVIALISNVIKRINPSVCERYFYRDVSQS